MGHEGPTKPHHPTEEFDSLKPWHMQHDEAFARLKDPLKLRNRQKLLHCFLEKLQCCIGSMSARTFIEIPDWRKAVGKMPGTCGSDGFCWLMTEPDWASRFGCFALAPDCTAMGPGFSHRCPF